MATAIELKAKAALAIAAQNKLNAAKALAAQVAVSSASPNTPIGPQPRIFFARIPHSKFIFSDNVEAIFAFGKLEVSPKTFPGIFNCPTGHGQKENPNNGKLKWLVYLAELNAIVPPNGQNPNIFTEDTWGQLEELPNPEINAVDEISLTQAENSIAAAGNTRVEQQSGPITIGGLPSNVGTSSLDADLLKSAQNGGATVLGNTNQITKIDPTSLDGGMAAQSTS